MKRALIEFSVVVASSIALGQGANVSVIADGLLNVDGSAEIALNTPYVIVVDTAQDGFLPTLNASLFESNQISLAVDSFIDGTDGDDLIVRFASYNFLGTPLGSTSGQIVYDDLLGANDPVGIYWFPGLETDILVGGEFYGEFLGYDGEPPSGSPWVLPAAGSNPTLRYTTSLATPEGFGPDIAADLVVTPIPEPAALPLVAGLGALLLARRRF